MKRFDIISPLIKNFVDKLDNESACELLFYTLDQLPDIDIIEVMKAWADEQDFGTVENLITELEP
jgi:hypothetical protein